MIRWPLRILRALVVLILLAWGGLVYQYSEVAGPDVPKWQLALFIAQEVGARLHCAVTGCPAELPEGMTLRDWAGPDLVPSTPVALDVDPWHRVYVAEGDRNQGGAEDNRRHMYWLEDDLASTSVEDRRAYYEKWVAAGRVEDPELFTKGADRALVIEDGLAWERSASSVAARSSPVTSDGFSSSWPGPPYLPIVCWTTAVIASGENGLVM